MWMTEFVRAVKRGLRDKYGFKPVKVVGEPPNEELVFDSVPDGDYPMEIEGKLEKVQIVNGAFHFFGKDEIVRKGDNT